MAAKENIVGNRTIGKDAISKDALKEMVKSQLDYEMVADSMENSGVYAMRALCHLFDGYFGTDEFRNIYFGNEVSDES